MNKTISELYEFKTLDNGIIKYNDYVMNIFKLEPPNLLLTSETQLLKIIEEFSTILNKCELLKIYVVDMHEDLTSSLNISSELHSYTANQLQLISELKDTYKKNNNYEKKYFLCCYSEDESQYQYIFKMLNSCCNYIYEVSLRETQCFIYNLLNRTHLEHFYSFNNLKQIMCNEVNISTNNLKINDDFVKYYIVKNFPITTASAHLLNILKSSGINLVLCCSSVNQKYIVKRINERKRHARSELNSINVDDISKDKYQVELESLNYVSEQAIKSNELYLKYEVIFEIKDKSKEKFQVLLNEFETLCLSTNINIDSLNYQQLDAHLSFMPTKYLNVNYEHINLSSSISSLYPFSKSSIVQRGGIYFGNALNQKRTEGAIILNPQSSSLSNNNILVVGMSGMGKSTTLKKIIYQQSLRDDVKIFSFDSDKHEYVNLTSCYGGKTIDVNNNRINIFEYTRSNTISNRYLYQITQIKIFLNIYFNDIGFDELQLLEKFIKKLYIDFEIIKFNESTNKYEDNIVEHSNNYPTFSDLFNLVMKYENCDKILNRRIKKQTFDNIYSVLNAISEGEHKEYFNGHSTFNIDKIKGVNFDILELRDQETNLFNAQMFIYLNYIWNYIRDFKNEHLFKLVVIDELHLLVNRESISTSKWLNNIVKRIRKYIGSLVIATQQFSDLMDEEVITYSSSLLANPDFKIIYNLGDVDIDKVTRTVFLSENEIKLVNNSSSLEGLIRFGSERYYMRLHILNNESSSFGDAAKS